MASGYLKGIQALMGADIDLINDEIYAVLIDTAKYPDVDFTTDQYQSIVPDTAQLSEVELTGKTLDSTTFRADSPTFPNVVGDVVDAVLIYKNTGVTNTSRLIALLTEAPEFPITPDGSDITINFSVGADGIFTLNYAPTPP